MYGRRAHPFLEIPTEPGDRCLGVDSWAQCRPEFIVHRAAGTSATEGDHLPQMHRNIAASAKLQKLARLATTPTRSILTRWCGEPSTL